MTGQLVVTADTFGNTGAASTPMALHAAREQGRLCPQCRQVRIFGCAE
ncbi:3-oxoacyl-[acyl-carrier-protein] synthase III C-terminal domain-containing protein [Streptomyces sp. NPDC001193]